MTAITILIPCYEEENFIGGCLDSVQSFDLPTGATLEVLVLDGMSTDNSRKIIAQRSATDPRIRLVDNPDRFQSQGLNRGIRLAVGEYIVRLDAHAWYERDYLMRCLESSRRTGADNVGGIVITQARGNGYQAALVLAMTTHKFGVGNSGFRTGATEGPADTVPYGCFRRDTFSRVGLFDERLVRAQDYEMNRRIIQTGGLIWLNTAIQVRYFQQPDLSSFLLKQLVTEAPYNAYLWYLAPYAFAPRHAVTAVFACGVLGGFLTAPFLPALRIAFFAVMATYGVLALFSSGQQAVRFREPRHLVMLPMCFFLYHFLHGLGIVGGLSRLALGISPVQKKPEPWPGAGRFRALPPLVGPG